MDPQNARTSTACEVQNLKTYGQAPFQMAYCLEVGRLDFHLDNCPNVIDLCHQETSKFGSWFLRFWLLGFSVSGFLVSGFLGLWLLFVLCCFLAFLRSSLEDEISSCENFWTNQ
ncbi:hypothetical protein S83_024994, partial [Arachis hypogaea]